MKKSVFSGFAMLLALVMFSCDGLNPLDEAVSNVVGYTDDNRALVELSLSVNEESGRALTESIAKGNVNYYEVVFAYPLVGGKIDTEDGTAPTKIYRTSWSYGQIATIVAPAAEYNNETTNGAAFMFAGRQTATGLTLLAIGKLTNVKPADGDYPAPGSESVIITNSSAAVKFTLAPLETDVKADPLSTFKLWGVGETDTSYYPENVKTTTKRVNGINYPAFLMPKDDTPIAAYFGIKLGAADSATGDQIKDILLLAASGSGNKVDILFRNDASINGYTADFEDSAFNPANLGQSASAAAFNTTYYTGTGNTTTLYLPMNIVAKNEGYAEMSISVPVNLCSAENAVDQTVAETWYLRGGVNNLMLDAGQGTSGAADSFGGAVLLGVDSSAISLVIENEYK